MRYVGWYSSTNRTIRFYCTVLSPLSALYSTRKCHLYPSFTFLGYHSFFFQSIVSFHMDEALILFHRLFSFFHCKSSISCSTLIIGTSSAHLMVNSPVFLITFSKIPFKLKFFSSTFDICSPCLTLTQPDVSQ